MCSRAMGDHFIRHIALLGFEKRFVPSQHYVSTCRLGAGGRAGGGGGGAGAGPRTARGEGAGSWLRLQVPGPQAAHPGPQSM